MRFIRLIKANLTEEEINQIKNKFNSYKWSDIELYNPDVDDAYEAWERITDIINDDYLTSEQKEKVDSKDYEKIIGMTFEQFTNNRQNAINKRKIANKIELLKEDLSIINNLIEKLESSKLNFDYDFQRELYQEKDYLEEQIKDLENK